MDHVAFIFPGQGSQAVGMGRALYEGSPEARQVIDAAHDALAAEVDLKALLFEGPEEDLKRTANTQPAILTVSVAAHAAFAARFPEVKPALLAGHSLGEWSALVAGGALALTDAVRAVRRRGQLMQEVVPEGEGAMAAVMGLPPERVAEVCEAAQAEAGVVAPANYNAPEQTVIAGRKEAVERALALLKEAGARRAVPVPVVAPFHCALMEPVKSPLAEVLAGMEVKPPVAPVVSNVTAEPVSDPDEIRRLLVEQVARPVRWVESVRALAGAGATQLLEFGHGKVLAGLVRRIDKGLRVWPVGTPEEIEAAGAALATEGD